MQAEAQPVCCSRLWCLFTFGLLGLSAHHRHIVIEGNTIESCDGLNLLVSSVADVRIESNHFVNPQQHSSSRGADHFDPAALIKVGTCHDVMIAGNTVRNRGPYGQSLVVTSDPEQVKQAADAVKNGNP